MTLGIGAAFAMSACTRPSAPATTSATTPLATTASAPQLPKYPAYTQPLSDEHAFLQRAPAPDFWALAPYYVGQVGDAACSAASLTMLVNAARHTRALDSETPLVSQALLRERVASASWEKGLAPNGEGVTLDQLAVLAEQSLRAFGLQARRVQVTHVPDTSADALARWRAVLHDNERSTDDWLFVNFLASTYVGVGDCDLVPQVRAGVAAPPLRCEGRVDPGPMGHSALGASSTFGPHRARRSLRRTQPARARDGPRPRLV